MFVAGIVFFIIATMHLGEHLSPHNFPLPLIVSPLPPGMNCFRMIRGFVDHALDPGGAVGYLGALAPWDHVFKDTLYATQEILGDGVAVSPPRDFPTVCLFSNFETPPTRFIVVGSSGVATGVLSSCLVRCSLCKWVCAYPHLHRYHHLSVHPERRPNMH